MRARGVSIGRLRSSKLIGHTVIGTKYRILSARSGVTDVRVAVAIFRSLRMCMRSWPTVWEQASPLRHPRGPVEAVHEDGIRNRPIQTDCLGIGVVVAQRREKGKLKEEALERLRCFLMSRFLDLRHVSVPPAVTHFQLFVDIYCVHVDANWTM